MWIFAWSLLVRAGSGNRWYVWVFLFWLRFKILEYPTKTKKKLHFKLTNVWYIDQPFSTKCIQCLFYMENHIYCLVSSEKGKGRISRINKNLNFCSTRLWNLIWLSIVDFGISNIWQKRQRCESISKLPGCMALKLNVSC